jgi:hypothetical protein
VPQGLTGSNVSGLTWILNPDNFVIQVSSTVPVNSPKWATAADPIAISNDPKDYNVSPVPIDPKQWPYLVYSGKNFDDGHIWNPVVNIKPMKLNGVDSALTITVCKLNDDGSINRYLTDLKIEPVVYDSSGALWSDHTDDKLKPNDPQFQAGCLTGFKITALPRIPNMVNGVLLIQLLYLQGNNYFFNYQLQVIGTDYKITSKVVNGEDGSSTLTVNITGKYTGSIDNQNYVLKALNDSWVSGQRNAILANLRLSGFDTYEATELTTFGSLTSLTNWPQVMQLSDALTV